MKVLVTGGCGFIGSHIVDYLLKTYTDVEVLNVDSMTYAADYNNVEMRDDKRYTLQEIDIADLNLLHQVWEEFKPDYVIHAAAESHVDRSLTTPQVFVDTNITGTLNLLHLAQMYNVKNFHYVSTDEVYGERITYTFRENDTLDPRNAYSASKASAEGFVGAYANTYGLRTTMSRGCNTFGPKQNKEKFIPTVIASMLMEREIPIYGDGGQEREWMYVEDHARLIVEIALNPEVYSKWVYNLGTGKVLTNLDIVSDIEKLILPADEKALKKSVPDRLGHDRRYAMDSTLAAEDGLYPSWDYDKALEKTVKWYLMSSG